MDTNASFVTQLKIKIVFVIFAKRKAREIGYNVPDNSAANGFTRNVIKTSNKSAFLPTKVTRHISAHIVENPNAAK